MKRHRSLYLTRPHGVRVRLGIVDDFSPIHWGLVIHVEIHPSVGMTRPEALQALQGGCRDLDHAVQSLMEGSSQEVCISEL